MASVTIYEMMEYCRREMIKPPDITESEIKEEIESSRELFKKI